ncbi:MAG: hypothetical protein MK137_04325 [Rickettsiales bacterium]|nr:hypothetical protein [Rickettsiales bacterium]
MPYNTYTRDAASSYLDPVLEGRSWTGTVGASKALQYSFGISATAAQKQATASILNTISEYTNLTFSEIAPFAAANPYASVSFFNPQSIPSANSTYVVSDVYLGSDALNSGFNQGDEGYEILMHEILHSMGLKHIGYYEAGDQGPFVSNLIDNKDTSAMAVQNGSRINATNNATTPMMLDIAALQFVYGANTSTNNGDDTYIIGTNDLAKTLWDAGGNDTVKLASSNHGTIDLREFGAATGSYNGGSITAFESSVSLNGDTTLWFAKGSNIENAVGNSGANKLLGNQLDNTLLGNGGDDTVIGGGGDDFIEGSSGNDVLLGEGYQHVDYYHPETQFINYQYGDDSLFGGSGNDLILGGNGGDFLQGNSGEDRLYGEEWNDTLLGGKDNDFLFGGTHNDWLFGNSGNDLLDGEAGNDFLQGNSGTDSLLGGTGDDTLRGGKDQDTLHGGSDQDRLLGNSGDDFMYGEDGFDALDGGSGNDLLDGGNHNDVVLGGSGADTIYGGYNDDFLQGNTGSDLIFGDYGPWSSPAGNDFIRGGKDNDTIIGSNGINELYGDSGNDSILARGKDTVYGGSGNDDIISHGSTRFCLHLK